MLLMVINKKEWMYVYGLKMVFQYISSWISRNDYVNLIVRKETIVNSAKMNSFVL